jgi:hypothetical protein
MEVFMKKITFIFIMFFALFVVVSDTIIANIDTEYDKALKYYNSGKYKEAVTLFKEYVKKNPKPSAYYRIGYALYELGKYDEATDYFKEAYLIDPTFSPELVAPPGNLPEEATKQVSLIKKPSIPPGTEKQQATKQESTPEKQLPGQTQPQKTQEPKVTPEQGAPLPEPQKIEPQQRVLPPVVMPTFPKPAKGMPSAFPGLLSGLMAGLGMVFLVIGIAVYLYSCLCIFIIALVQLWTIVSSAGKPGWWVILFIIPIVGIIVYIYLWICITENLGKNKWLGLLMLLPIINLIFMGMLAFTRTETKGGPLEGVTPA